MYRNTLLAFIIILTAGCIYTSKDTEAPIYSIEKSIEHTNHLADLYTVKYFEQFPEIATYHAIYNAQHDKLTDNTLESIKKWHNFEDSLLHELIKIDNKQLIGKQEWVTYGFLKEILEASIQLRVCRTELWQVNHLTSWFTQYIQLAQSQPIGNDTLREKALNRWSQLPRFLEIEKENLKEGIKLGYTAPRNIVLLMVEQIDELLALPINESPFFSPAQRDTNQTFQNEWKTLVADSLIPAIKNYNRFLKGEYLDKARTTISVSALPGGSKCYEAFFRFQTSTSQQADDIFEIASFYVKLNEAKIQIIGEKLFYTSDFPTLKEYIRNKPMKSFNSKEELLAFINQTVLKAKMKVPDYFNILPKSELIIKQVPEHNEKYGTAYYQPPSGNSKQPAVFYVNVHQLIKGLKGQIESTVFHETYPGHHMQLAVASELPEAHIITKLFLNNGFNEGWANYATILAEEIGLFSSDLARLYFINKQSKMMVLDAGIHAKGWPREYAIDYLMENTSMSKELVSTYVDRVIAWPGQFSTYDAGTVEILELRERAKIILGDHFDIREFHDQVIGSGSITLGMLRQKIDRWIALKKEAEAEETY
ncbi:MAG: DUF885 domain-containing protein [Bacteroidota bacterium]